MPLHLRYKFHATIYRIASWAIKALPLLEWVMIKTRYGVMIVPKTFRALTMKLDLVEPEVKGWLHESLRQADVFVDVGAAYGYYALKAVSIMGGGLVLAFEPDPVAYAVPRANLAINGLRLEQVKTYMLALSDKESVMTVNEKRVQIARLDDTWPRGSGPIKPKRGKNRCRRSRSARSEGGRGDRLP